MNQKKPLRLTESQTGFLLVLPALAVFCFIILYPFLNSFVMSLTNQNLLHAESQLIGLTNFKKVLADPNFLDVVLNTVIFVIGGTLLPFLLGLIWALVLNQGFKGSEVLRGITLVDWIIPSTAIGFLWMWIFHGEYGLFNALLQKVGLIDANVNWLGNTDTAMLVVIIAKTWQTLPWFMAFLLGGLQGVQHDQVEAAKIDGAGNWQVLWNVILPSIKPIISLVLILGTIGSLQHFDLLWVMTEGGPARATTTFSVEVYRTAFQEWNLGVAAAIGMIWVFLLFVFSIFYFKKQKEETV
ncbi:carbohydrate ABC transporter permease [Novibacillus thermophilus]|uniref:Sugar ABC transporter permease n=1 Tax=Novibacillus thermophilus TaxID=1471761 RepID=A0A1U9KAA2_9BACL|nr:sugar ABC transporter permease [Novibacillus thermophilus]AQS56962.1 sugar ABC transporter permease [Novibacillus thermophilus]